MCPDSRVVSNRCKVLEAAAYRLLHRANNRMLNSVSKAGAEPWSLCGGCLWHY
jgi:hypothetical protein